MTYSCARSDEVAISEAAMSAFETQAAVLHELKRHIDLKIADLAKQRNFWVPINKLPAELVSQILAQALPNVVLMHRLWNLARVQTRWRNIILSHAQFWSTIYVEDPLDVVALKLRRSGSAPLTISRCFGSDEEPDYRAFQQLITPHLCRWRVFTPSVYPLEVVRGCLEQPLPMLERLCVWGHRRGEPRSTSRLELIGGPHLRHIFLDDVDIPFQNGCLSNLLSLSISGITDALLRSALPKILLECPDLADLVLESIGSDASSNSKAIALPPSIPLPRLERLRLFTVPPSLYIPLLSYLQPPDTCFFSIFSDKEPDAIEILHLLLTPRLSGTSIAQTFFSQRVWSTAYITVDRWRLTVFNIPSTLR